MAYFNSINSPGTTLPVLISHTSDNWTHNYYGGVYKMNTLHQVKGLFDSISEYYTVNKILAKMYIHTVAFHKNICSLSVLKLSVIH